MPRGRFSVVLPSPYRMAQVPCRGSPRVPSSSIQLCNGSGSLVLHTRASCAALPQTTSLEREVIMGKVTCDIWKRSTSRTPTPKSFPLGGHSCGTALSASPGPTCPTQPHLGDGMPTSVFPSSEGASLDPPAAHIQGGRQTARYSWKEGPT